MMTHQQLWEAIDNLAQYEGLSPSGLARQAGLDPTAFNKSKRFSTDGKPRWPSTESLAKILDATGTSLDFFSSLFQERYEKPLKTLQNIPIIGLAQAGDNGFFDDSGFPIGGGWEQIPFPHTGDENTYGLEVNGDSMKPLYRNDDIIIVSPNSNTRKEDRVVVKTREGEVLAKILKVKTQRKIELQSFNPDFEDRSFLISDIEWIARILWVSQ